MNTEKFCSATVLIVQFNVFYENMNIDAFIDYLHSEPADLVVMQEVSPMHRKNLSSLAELYPYQFKGMNGMNTASDQMILSRTPLLSMSIYPAPDTEKIIMGLWQISDDKQISLITAHLPSPRNAVRWQRRNTAISFIEQLVKNHSSEDMLIIGDFNLSSASLRYRRIFSDFTHFPVVSWPNLQKGSRMPTFAMIAIDHLWLKSRQQGWQICSRSTKRSPDGSDHKMVLTKIAIDRYKKH